MAQVGEGAVQDPEPEDEAEPEEEKDEGYRASHFKASIAPVPSAPMAM